MLAFSFVGFVLLYGLPQQAALAFNTSVSFVTTTNWRASTLETTMS
jgi:K+-transporting ATPase A subunit